MFPEPFLYKPLSNVVKQFQIINHLYTRKDIDRIYYIQLKTDNVATAEGVDLSMNKDGIISVYGEDYTEDGHKMVYAKGGMELSFILNDDGTINSIEYDSTALGQ